MPKAQSGDRKERLAAALRENLKRRKAKDLVGSLAEQAGVAATDLAGAAFAVQAPIDRASGAIAPWAANRLPGWTSQAQGTQRAARYVMSQPRSPAPILAVAHPGPPPRASQMGVAGSAVMLPFRLAAIPTRSVEAETWRS